MSTHFGHFFKTKSRRLKITFFLSCVLVIFSQTGCGNIFGQSNITVLEPHSTCELSPAKYTLVDRFQDAVYSIPSPQTINQTSDGALYVSGYAFDPAWTTSMGYIRKSTDGGTTWTDFMTAGYVIGGRTIALVTGIFNWGSQILVDMLAQQHIFYFCWNDQSRLEFYHYIDSVND